MFHWKLGHKIEMNENVYLWATGRGARFIGDMHGVESDEVSILCHSVCVFVLFLIYFFNYWLAVVPPLLPRNHFYYYYYFFFSRGVVCLLFLFFKSTRAKSKRPVSLSKQHRTGKVCVRLVCGLLLVSECVKRKN